MKVRVRQIDVESLESVVKVRVRQIDVECLESVVM